jgi:hypothetical protein
MSMTLETVPFEEAVQRALRGEYPDAKTIIGLIFARQRMDEERKP